MESEQTPPLFFDPLATKLAGTALEDARKSSMRGTGKDKKADTRVSRIAIRTKWFDAEVEAALRGETTGSVDVEISCCSSSSRSVRVAIRPRLYPRPWPTQVVSLGCGMDTRPWRLDFPPSRNPSTSDDDNDSGVISWFDVDSPSVLRAKARELRAAGVEVPDGAFDLAFEGGKEEEEKKRKAKIEHPLKVSHYRAVPADLSQPNALCEALAKAGHDKSKPTVFVAEGLLMYLGEEGVRACLSSAAEAAGGGSDADGDEASSSSSFVAVTITPAALKSAHERSRRRQEAQGNGRSKKSNDAAASDLLAAWNFGCSSAALPRLLRETGWLGGGGGKRGLLSAVTRSDMARRYEQEAGGRGFEYEVSAPRAMLLDSLDDDESVAAAGRSSTETESERGSLFFVARLR